MTPTFKEGVWPNKKINLGLDLQGGMHLILEVKTEKAVESTIERIIAKLREAEVELSRGQTTPEVCRKLGISENTYYRWRKENGA